MGLEKAFGAKRVWWVAPTYAQSSIAWRLARPMASQVPGVKVREAVRCIEFPGGGTFWFKSADAPDNLRGEGIDFLVLDECDFIDEKVWEQVLRPALADRRGGALFVSTPNTEGGYFHQFYLKGQSGEDSDWVSWSFPSESNPFLDPKEIAAARAQLPGIVARREFGAEFVSAGGARIQRDWIQQQEPPFGMNVVMGVDLAISTKDTADYTAIVVVGEVPRGQPDEGKLFILDAQQDRLPFHQVLMFIQRVASRWSPKVIGIEAVQYQSAVVTELARNTKLPVRAVKPDRDKLTRFQPLECRYEQRLIRHAPWISTEFERQLLSFPVGDHDDLVDALSTAYSVLAKKPASYISAASATSRWRS